MSKGSAAKAYVEAAIKESFKENYIGTDGKKYYVMAPENGEMLQIAITLSCPKTPYAPNGSTIVNESTSFDWGESSIVPNKVSSEPLEITADEQNTLNKLLESLAL